MEVIYFMDEAILEFRQTQLTGKNVWLNVDCLCSKAQIECVKKYFEPAHNYLCSETQIGCIGEYFKPAHNCICGEVWIECTKEYFKTVCNC